ncbi:MAG: pyroglutamyl-peptidase I [Candidatus Nanopelagicaceae bacterium]|jgi:pyroglutamyl-peptidase
MKRVLITGFEPFNTATRNPSQEVIRRITHKSIVAKEVLPVTFSTSVTRMIELIKVHQPIVVIALGQAEGRSHITPEQVAINLDDAKIADNVGEIAQARKIIEDGPDAYFTTLPIRSIVERLQVSAIPASISLSAGTFVCNHLFYRLQHYCKGGEILSGFIHLPLMHEQADEFPGKPTMSIEEMVRGIGLVLDELS